MQNLDSATVPNIEIQNDFLLCMLYVWIHPPCTKLESAQQSDSIV